MSIQQISLLDTASQAHQCHWNRYKAPACLLNHTKTWTTTRWKLEHWNVQGGIKPLRTKYHQAYIFLIKFSYMIWYSCQKSSREEPSQLWFFHVARNLANYISIKLLYQFLIVCMFVVFKINFSRLIQLIVLPLWDWNKIFTPICFFWNGLIPKSDSG